MKPLVKTRLTLVAIALLFFTPVFVAWLVHEDPSLIGMTDTKNYGSLIRPAVPIDLTKWVKVGESNDLAELRGRWVMLHLDLDGMCDQACDESIKAMQQVHILLNKDAQRMQRRLISGGELPTEQRDAWRTRDPGLGILSWQAPLMVQKLGEIIGLTLTDGMVLVMDPLGNIMMHYPQNFDPYGVQSDLRLLFKASQVG